MNIYWHRCLISALISTLLYTSYTQTLENKKTVVLVIGLGSSGTSCLAGTIRALGVPFGSTTLTPSDPKHPKGILEVHSSRLLNDQILTTLGMNYFNIRTMDWNQIPNRKNTKNKLRSHLRTLIGKHSLFGIKDPRIAFLLPLYTEVLTEMGYQIKICIVVRRHEEVVKAWVDDRHKSRLCTLDTMSKYLASMLIYSRDYPHVVVTYDELLNHLEQAVERIRTILPEAKTYNEAKKDLHMFVQKDLKHY